MWGPRLACRGYKLVALKAIPISKPPRLVRHPLLPLAQKKLQRASEGREKPGTISSPALPFFPLMKHYIPQIGSRLRAEP
jgi:hypothetical protein